MENGRGGELENWSGGVVERWSVGALGYGVAVGLLFWT